MGRSGPPGNSYVSPFAHRRRLALGRGLIVVVLPYCSRTVLAPREPSYSQYEPYGAHESEAVVRELLVSNGEPRDDLHRDSAPLRTEIDRMLVAPYPTLKMDDHIEAVIANPC